MIYIRLGIISLIFFALIGCNTIKKKMSVSDKYRQSDSHDQVLNLPKEMRKIKINDSYPVPKITQTNASVQAAHVLTLNVLTLPPGSSLTGSRRL